MASEDEIKRLLANWDEARERGEDLHPEQLTDDPQAQSELRWRIGYIQVADAFRNEIGEGVNSLSAEKSEPDEGELPKIDGFKIEEKLGDGGMGAVYRAQQLDPPRAVALKLISLPSADHVARFRRETDILGRLDHPNILPVFGVGRVDDRMYFTMKLASRVTLARRIPYYAGRERAAAELVVTLADAIHHAHQRGIIHRDIKPENVLFSDGVATRESTPYVGDFGLAKDTGSIRKLSQTGQPIGTANYMPPEQARGDKDTTVQVDVYGLGAVLYELLTGSPPFDGRIYYEIVSKVLNDEPPDPWVLKPGANRDLSVIALKCLNKAPGKRYPTALALKEDLNRWLKGEPIEARPAGWIKRQVMWGQRNPRSIGVAVLIMTSLSFIFWQEWNVYKERERTEHAEAQALIEQRAKVRVEEAKLVSDTLNISLISDNATASLTGDDPVSAAFKYELGVRKTPDSLPDQRRSFQIGLAALQQTLHRLDQVYLQGGRIRAAARSPDGSRILFGDDEGNLDELDLTRDNGWRSLAQLKAASIAAVAFQPPAGDHFAVLTSKGTVHLFKAAGERAWDRPLSHPGTAMALSFRKDGQALLVGAVKEKPGDLALAVYDLTGKKLPSPRSVPGDVYTASFSPDGAWIAAGCHEDNSLRVWDSTTGEPVKVMPHASPIFALSFSPDGSSLATGCLDGLVRVFDTRTWEQHVSFSQRRQIRALAYDASGRYLLSGSKDGTAQLWDVTARVAVGQPLPHRGEVRAVAFSSPLPGAQQPVRLITTGFDKHVRVWRLTPGTTFCRVFAHPAPVTAAALSGDGNYLLTGCRDSLKESGAARLWSVKDPARPPILLPQHGEALGALFRPGAAATPKTLLVGGSDGHLRRWDSADGGAWLAREPLRHGRGDDRKGKIVYTVASDREGRYAAFAGRGRQINLIDLEAGRRSSWDDAGVADSGWVFALAFCPNRSQLLSGGGKVMKLWEVPSGKCLGQMGHSDSVRRIVVAPAGGVAVSTCLDGSVRIWSLPDCKLLHNLTVPKPPAAGQPSTSHAETAHQGECNAAAISPDGRRVATAGSDSVVRVWDVRTGALVREIRHGSKILAVGYSPDRDGRLLGNGL